MSAPPAYSLTTNRFTAIPGATPSYDFNGNLKADGTHNYTWDSDGRPHTINSVTLVYDALDRMVEQQSGSGNNEIIYGPTGKLALMNGQTLRKGVARLPGGGTAVYTSSGLASGGVGIHRTQCQRTPSQTSARKQQRRRHKRWEMQS